MALFSIETHGELQPHLKREWLVTNGIGGYAASTVVGCNTRRYHGLLCAAMLPPVGRIMAVNRIGEVVELDGSPNRRHELGVNDFGGGYMHPRGEQYLSKFTLDHTAAQWEFDVDGVRVTKQIQMSWLQNVAAVRYTVEADQPDRAVRLSLLPFLSLRDFHAERHVDGTSFETHGGEQNVSVGDGAHTAHVLADGGRFVSSPDWWYGHYYFIENERGQDDHEDLFTPGKFVSEFRGSGTVTLWLFLLPTGAPAPTLAGLNWDAEREKRRAAVGAQSELKPKPPGTDARPVTMHAPPSPTLKRLAHAANDFIVARKAPDGSEGTTVIAGYPWFADWGRDTFISLPGLLLATGRFAQARQVLSVFAAYVSEGMIPNRFDDYNNEPSYNTVDASLWFVHACYEYLRLSRDQATFDSKLLPACRAIIDGYGQGTRFHIRMDETDGLISQGDEHTQLTWMDAKCNGVAFTPRQGKPVEINALWYHALILTGDTELAARVGESFRRAFWIGPDKGLCDVIDGKRRDLAIRPNQIFAVSLPNSPLHRDEQRAVVAVVQRELLTPAGLRTLSRSDPGYKGRYYGPQFDRDGAYHNGTVWPWLLGPFLSAYLNVNDRSPESIAQAKQWLDPLLNRMETECIGQIAEICEGDEPHRPVGCFAQAWSIAEVLRLAVELGY